MHPLHSKQDSSVKYGETVINVCASLSVARTHLRVVQRRFHLEEGQVLRMMSETSKGQLGRLFFYMKSKAKLEKIVKRKKPVVNTKYILIA